jgi:hypothetical protein
MLLYFWCWQKSLLLQNIQKSRNCLIMLCIHKIYNLFHFEKKKLKPSNTQSHFYFQKNLNVFNLNFLKFNFYIPTYSKLSFLNKCCLLYMKLYMNVEHVHTSYQLSLASTSVQPIFYWMYKKLNKLFWFWYNIWNCNMV